MELKQNKTQSKYSDNNYLKHLNELGSSLKLSRDVQDKAKELLDPIFHQISGNYDAVYLAAGSLIIASRMENSPRSIPQVSEVIEEDKGYLTHLNKKEHRLKVRKHFNKIKEEKDLNLNPVKSGRLIEGTLEMLETKIEDKDLKEKAEEISEIVDSKIEFCDISQAGLAASAIYISSKKTGGQDIKSTSLSKASGRNPKTIQGTARKIINKTEVDDYA